MTPTRIWRERRKREIKSKSRAAVLYAVLLIAGMIPVLFKASEIYAENADTNLSDEIIEICEEIGEEYAICPELLEAMIEAESGGNQYAVSEHGAVGLMQLKPEYTAYTMEQLFDPETNIAAGTSIILEYAEEWDDLYIVLTAYRYGPFSKELNSAEDGGAWCSYAKKIVKRAEQLERLHGK